MLSILRAPHPPRTNQADKDLTVYENGTSSVQYHKEGSDYMMTHTIPPTHPTEGPSIIQPPFHYHIYQTEKFRVVQGTANMFFGLDKKPSMVLSSKGGKDSAILGPCRYHRFENASSTETLKINIHLQPEDYANEERFFKNFFGMSYLPTVADTSHFSNVIPFNTARQCRRLQSQPLFYWRCYDQGAYTNWQIGYLNDCKRSKTSPSIFQLFVFLHSADTPLAVPMPFGMETLGVYVSRALLIGVAYIGRYGLGYQTSYPEYYDSSKSR